MRSTFESDECFGFRWIKGGNIWLCSCVWEHWVAEKWKRKGIRKKKKKVKMKIEELKYVNGAKHASCGIGFGPTTVTIFYHNCQINSTTTSSSEEVCRFLGSLFVYSDC